MSNAKNSAAAQPAPAIDLKQGLRDLYRAYVRLLESGRDRITSLGGDCDPVDVMEQTDIDLRKVRDLLALIDGQATTTSPVAQRKLREVPEGFVLAPVDPTPEMVKAAEEAYMPFGDMGLAIQMAIAASPKAGNEAVDELKVWGTQRPGRMPKLFGLRTYAELNWYPDEGYDLVCLQVVTRITPVDHGAGVE